MNEGEPLRVSVCVCLLSAHVSIVCNEAKRGGVCQKINHKVNDDEKFNLNKLCFYISVNQSQLFSQH